jgi:hypothetical protein
MGDVELVGEWYTKYKIEDLMTIAENKGYSGFTLTKTDNFCRFKKFPF